MRLAWLNDGSLYLLSRGDSEVPSQVWRVRQGVEPSLVDLASVLRCSGWSDIRTIFPLGSRLGIAARCLLEDELRIVAVDPQYVSDYETLWTIPATISVVTSSADGQVGYGVPFPGRCEMPIRFSAGVVESIRPVLDGDRAILEPADQALGCSEQRPELEWVDITSDGNVLVFIVNSGGTGDPDRIFVQIGESPARMVAALRNVVSVAVSPDGLQVAVTVSGPPDRNGVWLIEVATGKMNRLASGDHGAVVFEPEGHHLAVIRYEAEVHVHEVRQ